MFAKRRMNHIFRPDGRTLIVAMDHVGFMNKPLDGLIRPNETVRKSVAHGADAIMTTMRTAKEMEPYLKEPFSDGWRPIYAIRKMGL